MLGHRQTPGRDRIHDTTPPTPPPYSPPYRVDTGLKQDARVWRGRVQRPVDCPRSPWRYRNRGAWLAAARQLLGRRQKTDLFLCYQPGALWPGLVLGKRRHPTSAQHRNDRARDYQCGPEAVVPANWPRAGYGSFVCSRDAVCRRTATGMACLLPRAHNSTLRPQGSFSGFEVGFACGRISKASDLMYRGMPVVRNCKAADCPRTRGSKDRLGGRRRHV